MYPLNRVHLATAQRCFPGQAALQGLASATAAAAALATIVGRPLADGAKFCCWQLNEK